MRIKKNGERYDQDKSAQDFAQAPPVSLMQMLTYYHGHVIGILIFLELKRADYKRHPELNPDILRDAIAGLAALQEHLEQVKAKEIIGL
jgi:hypothetical protein